MTSEDFPDPSSRNATLDFENLVAKDTVVCDLFIPVFVTPTLVLRQVDGARHNILELGDL